MAYLFYALFFFVPLVLFPTTSELFEFNKMVLVYGLTVLIGGLWMAKMIIQKKIIFRRTILDIPLLIFVLSQVLSTVASIDFRTSWLGYYSRFHGGLASTLSYSFLYWAYVSNMDKDKANKSVYFLFASAFLVSIYGVLEHFGIDKNIWVQDVQNRVFSTLGQPNWLAAWLVALIPLTWTYALRAKLKSKNFWIFAGLSALYFLTLLYTKSRSGFIGLVAAFAVFWGFTSISTLGEKAQLSSLIKPFLILNSLFLILSILVGTPWSPALKNLIYKSSNNQIAKSPPGPALEVGGTESGTIRKIVWKGALEIWKHYPILGTGVETFAYSYYNFRPVEHNLVSEWDFLYNKAHNEYLNFAATTGTVGLISYLVLIGFIIYQTAKSPSAALLAGFVSILVTNFFGFSVVPGALLFFLYPAIAAALAVPSTEYKVQRKKPETSQRIFILFVLGTMLYVLSRIATYWYADYLYAKGKNLSESGSLAAAHQALKDALNLSPHEAIYWDQLAQVEANIAVALNESKDTVKAAQFAQAAMENSVLAMRLSPKNLNLKRAGVGIFTKLSAISPQNLPSAKEILLSAIELAPTDAKLYYSLGLTYGRLGSLEPGIESLQKAVDMKANYREARLALALLFKEKGEKDKARGQLNYVLEKIAPGDKTVKDILDEMK